MTHALSAVVGDGPGSFALDLNGIISGSTGAALVALVIFVVKLVLDRTIPSRSDTRANVSLVLEGLSNMVKILQEEKLADSERLRQKQERIDELETDDAKNYDTIRELRKEIAELRDRLDLKERHIQTLIFELRKFGVEIIGVATDEPGESLEIRLSTKTSGIDVIRQEHGAGG